MNRQIVSTYTVLMLATILYASPISAQNLIQNGSFEDPPVPTGYPYYGEFSVQSQGITKWMVVGNMPADNVLIVTSYCDSGLCYHAEDPIQWLDLTGAGDNNDMTGVEQMVPTIPNHIYQLSYWVGTITTTTSGTQSAVNVSINGVPSTPCSGINDMYDPQNPVWKQITCTFTATGPTTTLTFFNGDGADDNINGLDNVQVFDLQTGYIEICKQSNPDHPVTGAFTFTATTAGGFSSGPITVPVGQCSGSIQVPSGALTVTETPVLGVAVSNVTAIAYDELGFQHDELNSWILPDLQAIVNVMAGDEDEETLTTFTNYAAPPGQLKLCKIAGDPITLGQVFMFRVISGGQENDYFVTAGPRQQGGDCVLAGNFPVNTQVTIRETHKPHFVPSSITVDEGRLMECQPSSRYCAVATVIPGITEVTFTNRFHFGIGVQ